MTRTELAMLWDGLGRWIDTHPDGTPHSGSRYWVVSLRDDIDAELEKLEETMFLPGQDRQADNGLRGVDAVRAVGRWALKPVAGADVGDLVARAAGHAYDQGRV